MKLVFFIDSRRKIGGGSYAQFVFAKHLALRGHEVVVFAGDRNFYSAELNVGHLKVYYRHTIPLFYKRIGIGMFNELWDAIYTVLVIKPFIKKFRPDWLIGYLRPSAVKAAKLGRQFNIRVANFVYENPLWMNQVLQDELDVDVLRSLTKAWRKTKLAYEKSDVLVPNSFYSGEKMKEWIPSAIISRPVYPGIEKIETIQMDRDIDIVYVGRLHPLKNVGELLLACSPAHKIVIMGKGEEESKLRKLATERSLDVQFTGSVSNEEKHAWLQRAKLLVFPSSFEGFGMPPLEALACGCQVLCSDIPVFREIYGPDVRYFKLHDVEEMRKKIKVALEGGTIPKSNLPEKYTWEKAAMDIESILVEHA